MNFPHYHYLLCILSIVLCFSITNVSAQQNDTLKTQLDLPTIFIEDKSLTGYNSDRGYSVFKLAIKNIDRTISSTNGLSALFNRIPGVQYSERGNQAVGDQITIRGAGWRSQFGVRGIHLIEDGHSITSLDGQTNMEGFNTFFSQSIQVYRGPAALMWGNGSGGVIHVNTFDPAENEGIQIHSFAGDHRSKRTDISVVKNITKGKLKYMLSTESTDGYREYASSQKIQMTVQQIQLFSEKWIRKHKIRYAGLLNSDNPGTLDLNTFNNDPFSARDLFVSRNAGKTTHDLLLAETLLWIDGRNEFSLYSNYGVRSVDNPLPFAYINLERNSGAFTGTYKRVTPSLFEWLVGIEVGYQRDSRLESTNDVGNPKNKILLLGKRQFK